LSWAKLAESKFLIFLNSFRILKIIILLHDEAVIGLFQILMLLLMLTGNAVFYWIYGQYF